MNIKVTETKTIIINIVKKNEKHRHEIKFGAKNKLFVFRYCNIILLNSYFFIRSFEEAMFNSRYVKINTFREHLISFLEKLEEKTPLINQREKRIVKKGTKLKGVKYSGKEIDGHFVSSSNKIYSKSDFEIQERELVDNKYTYITYTPEFGFETKPSYSHNNIGIFRHSTNTDNIIRQIKEILEIIGKIEEVKNKYIKDGKSTV